MSSFSYHPILPSWLSWQLSTLATMIHATFLLKSGSRDQAMLLSNHQAFALGERNLFLSRVLLHQVKA